MALPLIRGAFRAAARLAARRAVVYPRSLQVGGGADVPRVAGSHW
jgi:hypothetical protein